MVMVVHRSAGRLWEAAQEVIAAHHLLKHPFYQLWTEGKLPLEALRCYTRQYFHQVLAFPRYLSAVHAHCPNLADRQEILSNLAAEELGTENHPELWLRFAEGLGVERSTMGAPNPQTQEALATQLRLSQQPEYGAGLAVVWAYEVQVPEVASQKIDGLTRHYGIQDERTLQFFRVHAVADEHHSRTEEAIIGRWADTSLRQEAVLSTVTQTAQALNRILDGVMIEARL
ncbi:CADD family putative folate metabolism protein [Anthocerotibacter panamensis]|uniref:CADD family putative folate metabolism protein n=1 Tax=Anthocerotibacter panamensis TaxID=2857077 RepID=UPI001C405821|nr:CADD family putative folate metabolism protein [Anthocerotibacter panamensis]